MNAAGGFVYFFQVAGNGPVKIGSSQSPEQRLRTIQSACPFEVTLRAKAPGDMEIERKLHRHFLSARLRLEWFSPVAELLSLIEEVSRTNELPAAFRPAPEPEPEADFVQTTILDAINSISEMVGYDIRTRTFRASDFYTDSSDAPRSRRAG